ncbi:ABC transporter substrate-binding protein [Enterobacter asburiae]|uniref:ABC transporter substrate-binding protein n=2 Tax=Enterobacter cloacae complex TaxID=354276 RepID=UPI0032AF2907
MTTPILEARDLSKLFPGPKKLFTPARFVTAVDRVSLAVMPGETLAIVGESGSGKSTLGRLLLRLLAASEGRVFYQGEEITDASGVRLNQLRRELQIIFQDPFASLNPRMTVEQIVGEPLWLHQNMKKADRQYRIVLTRFDNYWNKDAYHFDKIIYLPIPDASVRLANLRAGDLDLTEGIAASDVKTVEADSKLALAKVTGLGYQGITFNINNGKVPANEPFKDARVREAFSQAIDRDALNQVVFEGLYTPANQAFSPVSPYHVNLPVPPRDVDKAKALLKAAGVTAPLTVNLLVPNNPTSQQVGQVLQAMVAEAGFNLNLQMTEFATLLDRQQSGDYQLSFSGWSGRPDPDGSIYGFINSKGTLNDGRYSNAQVDEWLTQARQSTDQAARQPLYDKVVKQLQTDMPIAYLYFEPRIFGLNKSVQGFKPYPDGIVRLAGLTLAK